MYTEMTTHPNDRPSTSKNKAAQKTPPWEVETVIVQGENRTHLVERLKELQATITGEPPVRLVDIAATLNTQAEQQACRIALVAATVDELSARIDRALGRLSADECPFINDAAGIYYFSKPLYQPGSMAFLFPGEGAQYLSMLGDLCPHFPEVDETLAFADNAFRNHDPDAMVISDFVRFPKNAEPEEVANAQRELGRLDSTMVSVLFADWSINRLLENLELKPDVIAGHSAGELAALGAAKSLDVKHQAVNVVGMMQALRNPDVATDRTYELLAIGASREVVGAAMERAMAKIANGEELHLAMDNCPHQTVLVATPDAMTAVVDELTVAKVMHEKLQFDRPYHTYLFEPYLAELAEHFAEVPFHNPPVTVYSCTTARPFPRNPDEIRDLALSHWASPVRFTDMVRQMHADGVRIFVEAGPRGNLSSFAADILRGEEFLAVASNVQRRSGIVQLNHMVAQLAAHHVPMRLDHLYERRDHKRFSWPLAKPSSSPAAPAVSQQPAPNPTNHASTGVVEPNPQPTAAPVPNPAPASPETQNIQPQNPVPPVSGPSETGTVMNLYLSVMDQFLSDQEAVTKAYLQQRNTGRRRSPRRSRTTAARTRQPAHPLATASPQPPVAAPPSTGPGPLIGEIVSHDPGKSLVMRRRLDLKEDIYAGEHTVGGRDVSKVDPTHHGLPVMPMTFNLEMMAEVGSLLVPGYVVAAICDVQLQRWLAFDADVGLIQVSAIVSDEPAPASEPSGSKLIKVEVRDLGSAYSPDENGFAASSGTVVMAPHFPAAPKPKAAPLENAHPTRPTLDQVYQSLFHGPLFQGVTSLDTCGDAGIDATIRVLPRNGLLRSNDDPQFLFDPVFIDVSMHPTVAWHLEQPDQSGRILLPYEMKRIEFFGPCPVVGAEFTNRSRVAHASSRQFHQDGEIIDSNGHIWCRLNGVRSWRFYLPFGEVNFHGPKDEYFLTKDWPQAMPGSTEPVPTEEPTAFGGMNAPTDADNWCVRFTPTPDLMQSALQTAAAQVTLSKRERQIHRALRASEAERSRWLFGRVAAKDAARILWWLRHNDRLFPADIEIDRDDLGRLRATPSGMGRASDFPNVSFASTNSFMVAAASVGSPVGVAIADLNDDEEPWDETILAQVKEASNADAELPARLTAARDAVVQALGDQVVRDPRQVDVRQWDDEGNVYVALDTPLCTAYPEYLGKRIIVRTFRCQDMIIATTLGQCEAT